MSTSSKPKQFDRSLLPKPADYYSGQGVELKGSGEWRTALCPFHHDTNPSLRVSIVEGAFKCMACDAKGGDVLAFHQLRTELGFLDAAQQLGALVDPRVTPSESESLEGGVDRLFSPLLTDGYKREALHVYTSKENQPLYWVARFRHADKGKQIRPLYRLESGVLKAGKPGFGKNGSPLYRLADIASKSGIVVITEGELKADLLAKLGLLVTTSGGAQTAATADWSPLKGRTVLIWPDHDAAGARYADAVYLKLNSLGCTVRVLDTSQLSLPSAGDAKEWLDQNPTATLEDVLALPCLPAESFGPQSTAAPEPPGAQTGKTSNDEEKTVAAMLIDYVLEKNELLHDENKDPYARDRETSELRRLDQQSFKEWLSSMFFKMTRTPPKDQALREAISTLRGMAKFDGPCKAVHLRIAHQDGSYYLDLGQAGNGRAVRIQAGCWEVVEVPPVLFYRPNHQQALPVPAQEGNIENLWRLLNIPDDARLLVLAWLLECLRPETPFPVLELLGEQGSAKSTTHKLLRSLIDPNSCNLRAAPKSVEDLWVAADGNHLVSFENVSDLSPQMQDAICVIATGGAFTKRRLYTDSEEHVISAKRPVITNGICASISAQDLVDRAMTVDLPRLEERTEITDIETNFAEQQASLLGALLTLFAQALARLPHVVLSDNTPRLVEFVKLGAATAEASGGEGSDFISQFKAARQESLHRTLEASPVADAVIAWFDARAREKYEGSLKELLAALERIPTRRADPWPTTPRALGDVFRRLGPALRQVGISITSLGKRGGMHKYRVQSAS